MKRQDLFFILESELISYRLSRQFRYKDSQPIILTYSAAAACQSKCKTYRIGTMSCQGPSRARKGLRLDEIEKIFKNMRPVYFFNMNGGEPFLEPDLPEIAELARKYIKPRVVHTPTNGTMAEGTAEHTEKITRIVHQYDRNMPMTVRPSINGVGKLHNEIRGIEGNFSQLLKTIVSLKRLENHYGSLHLELGTTASNFNIDYLDKMGDFVHRLGVKSYRDEAAEHHTKFFNLGDDITSPAEIHQKLIKEFTEKVRDNIGSRRSLAKTTETLRVVCYEIAGEILGAKKRVIPYYAGVSNARINYDGEVQPCCVLGYEEEMGNLRDREYDF